MLLRQDENSSPSVAVYEYLLAGRHDTAAMHPFYFSRMDLSVSQPCLFNLKGILNPT